MRSGRDGEQSSIGLVDMQHIRNDATVESILCDHFLEKRRWSGRTGDIVQQVVFTAGSTVHTKMN